MQSRLREARLYGSRVDDADRAFAAADADADGHLTIAQLAQAVPEAGAKEWAARRVAYVARLFDRDHDDKLDRQEFAEVLAYLERGVAVHPELAAAWEEVERLEAQLRPEATNAGDGAPSSGAPQAARVYLSIITSVLRGRGTTRAALELSLIHI